MKELIGKLSALDPEASEALKVVSFFDAMITNRAGLDALLRGAAVLAGTVAGAERNGRIARFDSSGQRVRSGEDRPHVMTRTFASGAVWLERDEAPHANDQMILERLAFAIALLSQDSSSGGLAVIIDASRSFEERIAALSRLRIKPDARIRLVATDSGATQVGRTTTVMPTRYGMLQATLDLDGSFNPPTPAGLGRWMRADQAPESWEGAVVARRLTTPRTPVIDAEAFGAMILLIRAYDPDSPHEDVRVLHGLDKQTAETLRVLVEADSIRSAAAELGMHHSTLQAKHENLSAYLGYDPRTTAGRMRYIAAEMLRRLGGR